MQLAKAHVNTISISCNIMETYLVKQFLKDIICYIQIMIEIFVLSIVFVQKFTIVSASFPQWLTKFDEKLSKRM